MDLNQGRSPRPQEPLAGNSQDQDATSNYESLPSSADGKGPGQLIVEITTDLSTLIRKEIELAKQELSETLKSKLVAAGLGVAALFVGLLFIPFILLTLMEVLAVWLHRWAAAAIVTGSMLGVAVVLLLMAKKKIAGKIKPEKTIESLKEDVEWAKNLKRS